MPIREGVCRSNSCRFKGYRQEHFYHTSQAELNPCDACGGPTELVPISRTHVVFTGPITARYNDRDKEGASQEGHMAWRRRSAKDSQKPEAVWIDTFEKQRSFCREEGLAVPSQHGNNFAVAEDGKTVLNSCGMPGCEV